MQILTRDYLVEGQLHSRIDDADYFNGLLQLFKWGRQHSTLSLSLLNAQVRPASNLTAPARAFAEYTLSLGPTVIAIVPKDADSQSSLHKALDDYKHPFPAVLYAGCYQVQATVLANSPLGWSNMDSFQPLADAQIDCLLPGAKLTNWQVPWLLLNGETVQGDGRGSA